MVAKNILVTPCHKLSQVVTFVSINNQHILSVHIGHSPGHSWSHWSVKVSDLNNDGLDVYYGYMTSNKELVIRARVRNASLILLASPQVKNTDSSS